MVGARFELGSTGVGFEMTDWERLWEEWRVHQKETLYSAYLRAPAQIDGIALDSPYETPVWLSRCHVASVVE